MQSPPKLQKELLRGMLSHVREEGTREINPDEVIFFVAGQFGPPSADVELEKLEAEEDRKKELFARGFNNLLQFFINTGEIPAEQGVDPNA